MIFWMMIATMVSAEPPDGWDLVGVTDGVEVSRRMVPNSNLFAFRGEAVSSVPVSLLSSLILNDPLGPEWVDLMNASKELQRYDQYTKLIYQGYDLPWPIQDRDYVMKQIASYDQEQQIFTATFQSVEDALMPEQECCIRAMAYRTFWHLEALPSGQTKIIVEVNTDPRGSLPGWLVNLIQEDWPHKTINALLKRVNDGDIERDPFNSNWQKG